jgi:DNA invertase Pin-like site-specific DNA recombinase
LERIIQKMGLKVPAQPKATRVAAYARVSSGKDAMLHSLSAQVSYYSGLIQNHPGWLYCGVYADEALTGTKENRENFQRLLAECRAGNIDLIITKSISRFARNTVVLLQTVRELKSIGVDVYFEEQNIHSMSADGELMLTILASYAQEESLSASENQKWRVRRNFEEGKPWSGSVLGYKYVDGVYIVKPEEAEIVRSIFADYLSGLGIEAIMKKLNAGGKTTRNGKAWTKTCVRRVLANYSYTGNLLLQTTFRENHITKKTLPNRGELPMYHAENTHEAIVSMEDYQAEMARRSAKHNKTKCGPAKYPFTSMIVCGICGKGYRRKVTRTGPVWICSTYNVYGKASCPSKQIPEGTLEKAAAEVLGLDAFDAKALHDKITAIRTEGNNTLVFLFKDGTQTIKRWADRSRAESWTPEMRAAASEFAKKGQAMRSCQQQEQ